MEMIATAPDQFRAHVLTCLAPIIPLDALLHRAGADPRRPPAAYVGGWADHLAWAVDSAVSAVRLLLCGQVVGAAAVARNQLERWMMHRAHNAGISQEPGETTIDYVARVWSTGDSFHEHYFDNEEDLAEPFADDEDRPAPDAEPALDHAHIRKSNGEEICPAVLYAFLSEIMHSRALPDAVAWDGEAMLRDRDWPPDVSVAIGTIIDTVTLCLREVRVAVATMAQKAGDEAAVEMLRTSLDTFSHAEPGSQPEHDNVVEESRANREHEIKFASPPLHAMAPLLPEEGLRPGVVARLDAAASNYLAVIIGNQRPAGRLYRDDELTTFAFVWHRSRSAHTALAALDAERRMLSDDFDVDKLAGRATMWVILTEMASLVGLWHHQPEAGSAASAIGSGLRSAYWMWLEDDDRAMSALRCVLEQVARLRVWRTKPQKAAQLESRQQTTPRDWIEAAGWRRLTALNRALGEFAHTKPTSRWSGARELLAKLHADSDPETAIFIARGASLDFVAHMVAAEVHATLEGIAPDVADTVAGLLNEIGLEAAQDPAWAEQRFNHIWSMRREGLGDGVFVGPTIPLNPPDAS